MPGGGFPVRRDLLERHARHSEEIRLLRLRQQLGGNAIVTIAPYNYPKGDQADYQCTGSSDQLILSEALLDGHSHFLLLPGDFYFGNDPDEQHAAFEGDGPPANGFGSLGIAPRFVTVEGFGRATVIHCQGQDYTAFYPSYDSKGMRISNLAFSVECEGASVVLDSQGDSSIGEAAVSITDVFISTPDGETDLPLHGITVGPDYQSFLQSLGGVSIDRLTFGFYRLPVSSSWYGIWADADDSFNNVRATQFHGGSVITVGGNRAQILNCVLRNNECADAAIYISPGDDVLLQGNTVTGTTGSGVDVDTTGATDLREVGNLIDVEV